MDDRFLEYELNMQEQQIRARGGWAYLEFAHRTYTQQLRGREQEIMLRLRNARIQKSLRRKSKRLLKSKITPVALLPTYE